MHKMWCRICNLNRIWYNKMIGGEPVSEEKNVSKPMQLWNSALKAVKGDSTQQLVEQFTAEMTLVAEGLCEDQARLRQCVDELRREDDRHAQRLASEIQAVDSAIRENQRETDRRLEDMQRRLSALESKAGSRRKERGWLSQVTLLVSIVCGTWLLVTVLNLFR